MTPTSNSIIPSTKMRIRRPCGSLFLAATASFAASLLAWTGHLVPVPLIDGGLNAVTLMLAAAVVVRRRLRGGPLRRAAVAVMPATAFLVREAPLAIVSGHRGGGSRDPCRPTRRGLLAFQVRGPDPANHRRWSRVVATTCWRWSSRPLQGTELYALGFFVLLPVGWLVLFEVARTHGYGGFWETLAVYGGAVLIGLGWHLVVDSAGSATLPAPAGSAASRIGSDSPKRLSAGSPTTGSAVGWSPPSPGGCRTLRRPEAPFGRRHRRRGLSVVRPAIISHAVVV